MNIKTSAVIAWSALASSIAVFDFKDYQDHRPVTVLAFGVAVLAYALYMVWEAIHAEVQVINVPADAVFSGAKLQIENPDGTPDGPATRII
jgi:hypothetical protein